MVKGEMFDCEAKMYAHLCPYNTNSDERGKCTGDMGFKMGEVMSGSDDGESCRFFLWRQKPIRFLKPYRF
ncbi:hypothetical protein BUE76_03200 [Cnuella takakiae]|nr:hypothetical protein BUE76_03200 [Cnuella takakiae]